jgi:heat shock protein HtpX
MKQLKTVLFLGLLTGLLMGAGYYLGGQNGSLIALGISMMMNFWSYWFSDKMVLSMYGAKQVTEAQEPQLYRTVRSLAQAGNLPMPKVYIIPMPTPNAFATGRNPKHAAIAVSPAIMQLLDERELKGVLAHELSHVKNRDILVSTVAATVAGALSYLVQFAYFTGGGMRDDEGRSNPIAAIALLILSPLIATLLHLAVSRSREYMADESGAKLAHDKEGLASALAKLESSAHRHPLQGSGRQEAAAHLFIVNPFRASSLAGLFSTHPPMEERIRRLKEMRI